MDWFKKRKEELLAQVNPFDGGKTASTVRASRPQVAPVQTVAKPRSTVSKVWDQVNTFDNGRTYKQATPTTNRSVVGQFADSQIRGAKTIPSTAKSIVDPFAKLGKVAVEYNRAALAKGSGNTNAYNAARTRLDQNLDGAYILGGANRIVKNAVGSISGRNQDVLDQKLAESIAQNQITANNTLRRTNTPQRVISNYKNSNQGDLSAIDLGARQRGRSASNVAGVTAVAETGLDVGSLGLGSLGKGVLKPTASRLLSTGVQGGVGSVASSYGQDVNFDITNPGQVGKTFATGVGTGIIAGEGTRLLNNGLSKVDTTPRAVDPNKPTYKDITNIMRYKQERGGFVDDAVHRERLNSLRKFGIDPTKPESWTQIDSVLSAQGGYIKNPLAKDPLESLKQQARKYGSAEEFVAGVQKQIENPANGQSYTKLAKDYNLPANEQKILNDVESLRWTKNNGINTYPEAARQLGVEKEYADITARISREGDTRYKNPYGNVGMMDETYTRQNLTDLYNQATQSQPPKSPLANDAPQGKTETPKTVKVFIKSKFRDGGGYADVPVIRKEENITLYQGTNAGDNRQFWTPNKKYAGQFGEVKEKTGTFYQIDNGNRMTDVYVEAPSTPAPQVGKTLKETRTNTTGIKNYNPDGLPTPANKVVQDLASMYESTGSGQGVAIVDGRRVSNNSPAYRELYAQLGRRPTSRDWYDYAYSQINNGKAPQEITDQFERTLNDELLTDKQIQQPEALNPVGSIPIKNKPSDMPTSDWESLIRSRVPDQTKVDVVDQNGKLAIQKKTIAPITKQETVQQTIPTEVSPQIKTKPDKDFTIGTNKYLGTLESAETTARSLADTLPTKLKGQDAIDAIIARDNGIQTGRPEIDNVNAQIDRLYNNLYAQYKDAGFDMGYVDNYSPRIYKHPKTEVPITKDEYLYLTRTPGQTISRTAQNVKPEDLLYKTPQELLAHYTRTFERAKAGREYFDGLKKSGHIVESGTRPDGMIVIDAPGMPQPQARELDGVQMQGNYYAYPDVAKKLNKVFGVDEGNKISNVTSKLAGVAQDVGLSGGVPFTPLNSFTFAQLTKELTAGKVSAPVKALFGSLTEGQGTKFAKDNAPIIAEMQKQGIRITNSYNTKTLNGFVDQIKATEGKMGKAGLIWDKAMSDPTFKRFMPRLQIETYKQAKAKFLKKFPEDQASEMAGSLVKNFYGLTDLTTQATRSKTGSDVISTLFFAPKYRESMARFWVNNAKALDPRKWSDPRYAQNMRFNVGAGMLFGAMQLANYALNGTTTFENPEGKKDKLLIPTSKFAPGLTGGKDIGVPFLSSIATVPRNIATGVAGAVTGNFGEVGKSAKSFLGYGVRPLADLANNEDYFGSQIYKEDGSTGEKLGSGASYLTKAFLPPYAREGINAVSNKLPEGFKDFVGARDQSAFETLARVGETPLRFYDPTYYRGEGDKFGTGGMPKAQAESEATKVKTARQLEAEDKKLKATYEKSFSKDDYKFLSKDSTERQELIDNGIKTQEELDGLDRYALNKRKELGMPSGQLGAKEIPEKIDGTDDKVKSFYSDRSYVHQDDYEAWQSKAPESDSAKDMIRRVSQLRPGGMPDVPQTNKVAELYADFKKDQANSNWSKLQESEKKKELLRTVYKTQLTDDQKFIDELGTEKLISAIDNGQVEPNLVKSMVELDNNLIKLGATAMLSKTIRNRYGLGLAPSTGGSSSSGRGSRGGKSKVYSPFMAKTPATVSQSLYDLIRSARV